MPKKSERARAKDRCDEWHSKLIRLRGDKCVVCGSKEQLTCGHVFSRTNLSLRWDLRPDGNCHIQCWPCNYRHEFDPYPYHNWYINKFGKKRFDKLHQEWDIVTHNMKLFDILELKEKFKEEYKKATE